MNNKKISVVIIAFLLLLNVSYAYSGTFVLSNAANNPLETRNSSKNDIVNHSSFKQISKNVYDACSKVYVQFRNDMFYFTSAASKDASIKKTHKIIHFAEQPLEYAFFGTDMPDVNNKYIFVGGKNFSGSPGGFNAIFVFVMAVFMLFLSALYRGSVPYSANIINNNMKARYL